MRKPASWMVSGVLLSLALLAAGCESAGEAMSSSGTKVRMASRRFPPNAQCPSCRASLWIGKVKEFAYPGDGMGGKPVPCPNCGEEFDPELEKTLFQMRYPSD